MELSGNRFDELVRKIQELKNKKEAQELSQDEIEAVGELMGVSQKDIIDSVEAYISQAQSFLSFRNWQKAQEHFSQALILAPNHPEALFGMATAHFGLWTEAKHNSHKKQALIYANRCLEVEPQHQGALRIINDITNPRNLNSSRSPKKLKFGVGMTLVGMIVLATIISWGIFRQPNQTGGGNSIVRSGSVPEINPSNVNAQWLGVDNQGAVLWRVYYEQEYATNTFVRNYYVLITDLTTGKDLSNITLATKLNFMISAYQSEPVLLPDNFMFFINENNGNKNSQIEIRNIRTGQISMSPEKFFGQFPVLKGNIGEITKESNYLSITTKTGDLYYYFPHMHKLMSEKEKEKNRSDYTNKTGWVNEFKWNSITNGPKKQFFLKSKQSSPYNIYESLYLKRASLSEFSPSYFEKDKSIPNVSKEYLEPIAIYTDSTLLLIQHNSEIGSNAISRLAAIGPQGNTLWEITKPNSILIAELGKNDWYLQAYRIDDIVYTYYPYVHIEGHNHLFAVAIDVKNGKILWEYSPTYKR